MTKQSELSSFMFCLHVLQLSMIFVSIIHTSSAQNCGNGSYQQPHFPRNEMESNNTYETTPDRMNASHCTQCNSTIAFCMSCHLQNLAVTCSECSAGYTTSDDGLSCTASPNNHPPLIIIIIVTVVVGGLLVVAGVIVLIVCLVRNERWRPRCPGKRPEPPRLPDPECMNASSYKDNKQQEQQSGSGRTGERYTKEPGLTPPRVQSVQYDGIELQSQRSTYINISGASIFSQTKRNEEEREEEEDGPIYCNEICGGGGGGGGGGDEYVNHSDVATAESAFSRSHQNSTGAEGRKGPGPMTKPKPQTQQITTNGGGGGGGGGHDVAVKGNRESVFPPDDDVSEQVYNNTEDSEKEDDDYVNVIHRKVK